MKTLFALTIFLAAISAVYGQSAPTQPSQCSLKLAQAPAVRGIKLGMSAEDLLALFPGSAGEDGIRLSVAKADNYPNFGVVGIDITPNRYSTKERFAGISYFNFVFLDGRVAQSEVQYLPAPNGPTWRNVDDFIAKIADAFHVPAAQHWTGHEYNPSTKDLKCDGFQLRVSNVNLRGSLTVATFDAPFKVRQDRLAAFEEKARRDFRP
jgi:hypothetical protein